MPKSKDYFSTFCKISKALGTTREKDELLDLIVESAIEAMAGKAACLFLADEERDVFVPVAQKGLSDNYLHADPMKAKTAVEGLFKEGYLAFRDAARDPRLQNRKAKKAEGIASILVVPVMVEGKAIGVLSLYTAAPRDFTEDEINFLSALAEQGGVAIQNARLIERLNQNSTMFYNMSSNINSSNEIQKILHILTADIGETFGLKGVSIRLYNPETKLMDLAASYGLSEEFLKKGPVSAEKSEIVQQILKGDAVVIADVGEDKRVIYREEARKEGLVSALCIPIKSKDDVIGELRAYSDAAREFPESLINLLQALVHQGGIAIENARLIRKMRMNTEFFHDLAVSINATLDIQKILHIMSADIAETIGVKASSIRLLDEEKKELKLVSSYGLSEKYLNKGSISAEAAIFQALKNRPAIVHNIETDEGVQYRDEKKEEGIASILTVPINARDDVIGVLRLYSGIPREFTEDDIILATAMAHQGGLAIQNASMYLMLQEDKKNLEEEIWSHRSWF